MSGCKAKPGGGGRGRCRKSGAKSARGDSTWGFHTTVAGEGRFMFSSVQRDVPLERIPGVSDRRT